MHPNSLRLHTLACILLFTQAAAWAQGGNGLDNLDWVEGPVPQPPAFSVDHQIAIDMPPHLTVKVGVDPATISVGTDGVVRYVVIMTNGNGNTNALYEGIRCVSDEVKSYARLNSAGQWSAVSSPIWKGLGDNMPSRHALAIARQGACQARLATSPQEIIAALKSPTRGSWTKKDY